MPRAASLIPAAARGFAGITAHRVKPEEVSQFLDSVLCLKHRVILTVCYAAGLRISEVVRLKPSAIDSRRMVIRVNAGKGGKDRYVMLSAQAIGPAPGILEDHASKRMAVPWPG